GCAEENELGADRERGVEVHLELGVDGQGESLGHALQAAGKQERRPEFAEPSGQRERRRGAESSGREWESDPSEDAKWPSSERSRGVEQRTVDAFEARDRCPQGERALREGAGQAGPC